MYHNLTRREIRQRNGTEFEDGDTINISDSHYEIWIKYGQFEKPNMHSTVFDLNRNKFQDVVFRQDYIRDFLRR